MDRSSLVVAGLVLGVTLGATVVGAWLRRVIPESHLGADAQDVIKLATGLIATMTALVLGIVIGTAKTSFDEDDTAMKQAATAVLDLDRSLARYGPETASLRAELRQAVAERVALIWPADGGDPKIDRSQAAPLLEPLSDRISSLQPDTDLKRALQARAAERTEELVGLRWTVLERATSSIPRPFFVITTSWLALIFASFGMFAPANRTVKTVLALSALSVAAAMFLVVEMDQPFTGWIRVPGDAMRYAVGQLGR